MFAIIETGGKQYKVTKGDILDIEKLEEEEGKSINFEKVLLVNDEGKVLVGTPAVEGAVVKGKVVSHKKGEKLIIFKMKAKKRYKRKTGHRQLLSTVEISDISVGGAKKTVAKTTTKTATKTAKPKKAPQKEAK